MGRQKTRKIINFKTYFGQAKKNIVHKSYQYTIFGHLFLGICQILDAHESLFFFCIILKHILFCLVFRPCGRGLNFSWILSFKYKVYLNKKIQVKGLFSLFLSSDTLLQYSIFITHPESDWVLLPTCIPLSRVDILHIK
jgi:hypothetical protein